MLTLPLLCDICGNHCRKTSPISTGYGIDRETGARLNWFKAETLAAAYEGR